MYWSHFLSKGLLSVTAQKLQPQGNIVDPAFRMNPYKASEQGRIKHAQHLLIILTVSLKDLHQDEKETKQHWHEWVTHETHQEHVQVIFHPKIKRKKESYWLYLIIMIKWNIS